MKRIASITAIMTLLVLTSIVHAFGMGRECHPMNVQSDMKLLVMENLLDLSEEQKTAIKELQGNHHADVIAQQENDPVRHLLALTPDQANYHIQVEELAKEKADRIEFMIISKARLRAEIFAILTPEQQNIMSDLHKDMRYKMKE